MQNWAAYLDKARALIGKVPMIAWVVAGLIGVSLAVVFYMELSGPPYAALYEGLSPADGGKVIAALQKLGIPYELEGAGNVILVPAPQLAAARLQLGAAQIPEAGAASNWDKVEEAPMTASELAQDTMAEQALEDSLAQSIETMSGIGSAQVFLALPPDTPFLADQPKPTASVVIAADPATAQAQGAAIAALVAGAVPGLATAQVTVETTAGVTVFPAGDKAGTQAQMSTVAQVENNAAARIALLLGPLVGPGNFRTDVSANLDFTEVQIHQIAYGPSQLVEHQTSAMDQQNGGGPSIGGVPGALSNTPPPATIANSPNAANPAPAAAAAGASATPTQLSKNSDQTYVTDQSESDITKPDWIVKSIAVSVVLNKKALGSVTPDQVKAAIAGAFAYPQVSVNVLVASFQAPGVSGGLAGAVTALNYGAVTRAVLQVLAAAALLFGLAMPFGKRLATGQLQLEAAAVAPGGKLPAALPPIHVLPPPDFRVVRERASENITAVARLLQSWVEDDG
jgi:flagellar M-ring protein FliF